MNTRVVLVGTCVSLAALIGCSEHDDGDEDDAGTDAAVTDSGDEPEAGSGGAGTGGRGGRGGTGGIGGRSGRGGRGGTGGAGAGGGGAGGQAGGDSPSTHSIGGEVSGLAGSGLVLQNNGGDDLTVTASGDFVFAAKLEPEADYEVTVKTQPSNPTQTCTVSNGSGEIGDEDVDGVTVTCTTNKYKIGGTLTGYASSGLSLYNNGGDALNAPSESFQFATAIDSGADYAVTVNSQPATQLCIVANGTGKVGSADVNVAVTCHNRPAPRLEPSFGSVIATWDDTGATSYTLKRTTSATCDFSTTSCPDFAEIANATTPSTVADLTDGTPYYFQLTANYPGDVKYTSSTVAARPNKARFDGIVYSVAVGGNGVKYAGGAFTRLSVHSGGVVPLNVTTGTPSEVPNFPIVDADIYAVESDGGGGYFIGGTFNAIGGTARAGIAHINADGTLDPAWDPGVTGGLVRHIVRNNSNVYIAGDFTSVGGQARAGLAAVGVNGALVAGFNPAVTPAGSISAIAFVGETLIVGGSFTAIGGGTQSYIAKLDGATGAIQAWNPNADGKVSALAVNGDVVYAGGEFANIGGMARRGVAALNGTGAMAAMATSWNPSPDNAVTQLAIAEGTVYIAGAFANVGSTARTGVAAIDATDAGTVREWHPTIEPANSVGSLVANSQAVYLGGFFTSVNGTARNGLAAVDDGGAGALTSWNPIPDGDVAGLALHGTTVFVAGQFRGLGGYERKHLVAFGADGKVTNWNPGADGNVYALATSGTQVYAGGEFTSLGGATRNRLGAVSDSGTLDATWNPNADSNVYALLAAGTTLYVGGGFTNIGNLARFAIAALDAGGTGAATTWNPGANSNVRALSLQGTTLYAGGDFTMFGTLMRNRLAAVTTASDIATAWDPNIAGTNVNAVVTTPTTVYVGGDFSAIGLTARNYLGAVDATTAAATAFAPEPSGIVHALALDNGALYAGGEFLNIQTVPFNHYAGWTDQGVFRSDYIFDFDLSVRALAVGTDVIYVSGDFQTLNGQYTSGFASVAK